MNNVESPDIAPSLLIIVIFIIGVVLSRYFSLRQAKTPLDKALISFVHTTLVFGGITLYLCFKLPLSYSISYSDLISIQEKALSSSDNNIILKLIEIVKMLTRNAETSVQVVRYFMFLFAFWFLEAMRQLVRMAHAYIKCIEDLEKKNKV